MSTGEGKVVCVTGASGFIASWLVKLLLQRGYTVKATVRDPNDLKKTKHLLALEGAKERLELFQAELLDGGSFEPAVEGCEGVFHTASPVIIRSSDPQTELIDPAVKGTLNVLQACAKFPSVKRVVLTSSIASVLSTGKPLTPDVIVDETWFSDPEICKAIDSWYPLSKTLSEQAAWMFAKENGLDMVSLHPVTVIGPLLQPTLTFSLQVLLNIINGVGNPHFSATGYRFIDVRDVANAHIQAFENAAAHGRYCLADRSVRTLDVIKIIKNLYPTIKLKEDIPFEKPYKVSRKRAESLGMDFIPLEVTIKDAVESLKQKGFLISF